MKAEQYLLNYIEQSHISKDWVREVIGVDLEIIIEEQQDMDADDFIRMCLLLGVNPDDVMNATL